MFTARGFGFVVGSYFTGYCDGKIDLHNVYIIGCIIYAISGYLISVAPTLNILMIIAFSFGFVIFIIDK